MADTPKDKLINGLAAFIRVNLNCTQKNAVDIANRALEQFLEENGGEIDEANFKTIMTRMKQSDLVCLSMDDAKQDQLLREWAAANYTPDSPLYQSCNYLLRWLIQSKTGLNEALALHLAEVLWDKAIGWLKSLPGPEPYLGAQRLHRQLIQYLLAYISAQTNQGLRQRNGVAENLAVNRIFTKAIGGHQDSINILQSYLSDKLPPILGREYPDSIPKPEIQKLAATVVDKVMGQVTDQNCPYDPQTKKSFIHYVLTTQLEIWPEPKNGHWNIDDLREGEEDQGFDEVIIRDELNNERRSKTNTITEIFRLILRCGGFPHEQLSYLYIDFLTTKPEKMVEQGLHEVPLLELRESFWRQIVARLLRYGFEEQKYLAYVEPLDQRLQLKVSALTSLAGRNDAKIAASVIVMEIARTKLADYNNYSNKTINQALSYWRDYVRFTVARILEVPSLDLNQLIYSPDFDPTDDLPRQISRNQCKLRDIVPCGGEGGTGCRIYEIVKSR